MKKIIFSIFYLLYSSSLLSQISDYIPPQRQGVSDKTYKKWTYNIKSFREQLKSNDIDNKTQIFLEFNIINGYTALKEPVDSIYNRLYYTMRLDTAFVCYVMIDGNDGAKYFGHTSYEDLSLSRWKKIYSFCKPYSEELESEHEKSKKEDEANLDTKLLMNLKVLRERDVRHRDKLEETEQKHGSDSKIVQDLWRKQQYLDSLNCILVDSIIDAYDGYVDNKITGEYHKNDLVLIALHSNSISFLDKHYPMFERLVKEKIINRDLFMILSDRYHLQKYGMQIFGTQRGYKYSNESNVCRPAPMYPEEKLIELKEELGFKHH